jgi:hypothetical protein
MAISVAPIISDKLFLQNLSSDIAALENSQGLCPEDQRAWVKIRQATEGDMAKLSQIGRMGKVTHHPDGSTTEEYDRDFNPIRAMQFMLTVAGAGNINNVSGEPLFKFKDGPNYPILDMSEDQFKAAYDSLPRIVTNAFALAVMKGNPQWGIPDRDKDTGEA